METQYWLENWHLVTASPQHIEISMLVNMDDENLEPSIIHIRVIQNVKDDIELVALDDTIPDGLLAWLHTSPAVSWSLLRAWDSSVDLVKT